LRDEFFQFRLLSEERTGRYLYKTTWWGRRQLWIEVVQERSNWGQIMSRTFMRLATEGERLAHELDCRDRKVKLW
jgi:hypothetical protein